MTLTIDEAILRAARKIALDRNTSVNQMVRDYLAELAQASDHAQMAERFRQMVRTSPAKVGAITWSREDIHNRYDQKKR
ncbi:MAG TPA: DUF6364 family protein [Bryobacteraceae bacterium]|nr:DUF6364 family protein [Bryobacteraceae bacterium]